MRPPPASPLLRRLRRAALRLERRLPSLPAGLTSWTPWRHASPALPLDTVRRRLEILLTAMYGRPIPILPIDDAAEGWWRRLTGDRVPPSAASDGETLRLPPTMDAGSGAADPVARYRLLAIEQAERVVRGTAAVAATVTDGLERDLFLLRESAAVDAAIVGATHGVTPVLAAERSRALDERPLLDGLVGAERDVEALVRQLLAADPRHPPAELAPTASAEESLAWARATAERLRTAPSLGRYRGIAPVGVWGRVLPPSAATRREHEHSEAKRSPLNSRLLNLVELDVDRPSGSPQPGRDASRETTAPEAPPSERPAPRGPKSADRSVAGQALADEEGTLPLGAGTARQGEEPPLTRFDFLYPEWDHVAGRLEADTVVVRTSDADESDDAWATSMLVTHAALVRRVRERFERLRAHRSRLPRQRDGEELDIAACVNALVDERTGHSVDDRLYLAVRPARREIAIALLVDVSGSTESFVAAPQRVIDVEKTALLLAGEALEALGDRYAMLTFSGKGKRGVRVTTVKDFAERRGLTVRRRISALKPEANTRLGAAIRHTTALLGAQTAGHRLLLILSDGKPNDVDDYQGPRGIEDSRQAVNEARAADVYPFCLTVDHEDSQYLRRIFGRSGYAILPKPEQLPNALLGVVQGLLS